MAPERTYYVHLEETGPDYIAAYCLDFFNKRIRVDDYSGNPSSVLRRMRAVAASRQMTKLFIKSRIRDWQRFLSEGCALEGIYKQYFDGEDGYCMAEYYELNRRNSDYWIEEDRMLAEVLKLPAKPEPPALPEQFTMRPASSEDAPALASLYRSVFRTYPTPMDDADYIAQAMAGGTLFYVIERGGLTVSAASAEKNAKYRNAEMTDCATLPAYRNLGLMRVLLQALEDDLVRSGFRCAYSLARALSFGMNAALFQMGYEYSGRLTKNCDIYDKFEDMNLWTKRLPFTLGGT
ncbi:putative beta-lysine N-acetyltransferase [Paenibacillus thermotolerans]|uniref:putative beta-lysine N-acetyltransferase n=1 Tax=Paenibacillus thermotolerans TaxID=3027807 RepID=UPI0023681D50|nr:MULTISPECIES: putative beta-lysine N-acetyltransferase [unclassified Paenibacillus]